MKKYPALVILGTNVLVFVLLYAYQLWDDDTTEISMFPFDDQVISRGAYANFICIYFSFFLLFLVTGLTLNIKRSYIIWFSIMWLGFVVDFILTYNNPLRFYYTHGFPIPMCYSLYAGAFIILVAGYEFFKFLRSW